MQFLAEFELDFPTPPLTFFKLKWGNKKYFHFALKCNVEISKLEVKNPIFALLLRMSEVEKTTSEVFLTTSDLVLTSFEVVFEHFGRKKRENQLGSPFVVQRYNIFRRNPNRRKTSF
ncbi:MAG: hypothetical protein II200_09240 [Bacteroidaceae bacterium]|nr:hypothetical protein [Bacteroidaceae bacterium]